MLETEKLITLQPLKVVRFLGFIVVLLILANIATQIMNFVVGHNYVYGLVPLFDMDGEHNIPAYFSAIILLIAAFLLSTIASFKKRKGDSYARRWRILSIIFLYLTMDEAACIHELLFRPTQEILGTGWLPSPFLGWVIPGSALVLIFALSYWKFLLHLPAKSRRLFLIAGILYAGGAVGMELITIYYANLYGTKSLLPYAIMSTVEETLEMAGIILFIYALLDYIASSVKEIRFRVVGTD